MRLRQVSEYLLPAPSAVLAALAGEPGRYAAAASETAAAAAGGLVIATGVAGLLAVAMAHSRAVERALYPPALLLKLTPIVAVYPLFTIWFGFGLWPKMLVAALITFFPTLVNAVVGLRSVDPAALDLLRSVDASPSQILVRLRIPSALPYLFAALRISVPARADRGGSGGVPLRRRRDGAAHPHRERGPRHGDAVRGRGGAGGARSAPHRPACV